MQCSYQDFVHWGPEDPQRGRKAGHNNWDKILNHSQRDLSSFLKTLVVGLRRVWTNVRVHTKNCNHFSRTFQGLPTRNIISQIVQKCIFPVYSNKTLRLELFASPTSLHSLKLKDFSRLREPCMSFHADWPSLNWANRVAVNATPCQLMCIL